MGSIFVEIVLDTALPPHHGLKSDYQDMRGFENLDRSPTLAFIQSYRRLLEKYERQYLVGTKATWGNAITVVGGLLGNKADLGAMQHVPKI